MGGPPNLYSRNPNFQNPDSPEKAEVGAASNEMAVGFPQTLNPKPFIVSAEGKQQPRSFALFSRSCFPSAIAYGHGKQDFCPAANTKARKRASIGLLLRGLNQVAYQNMCI